MSTIDLRIICPLVMDSDELVSDFSSSLATLDSIQISKLEDSWGLLSSCTVNLEIGTAATGSNSGVGLEFLEVAWLAKTLLRVVWGGDSMGSCRRAFRGREHNSPMVETFKITKEVNHSSMEATDRRSWTILDRASEQSINSGYKVSFSVTFSESCSMSFSITFSSVWAVSTFEVLEKKKNNISVRLFYRLIFINFIRVI